MTDRTFTVLWWVLVAWNAAALAWNVAVGSWWAVLPAAGLAVLAVSSPYRHRDHGLPAGGRPEGVLIHHPDGTTTPCELADTGVHDDDGKRVWTVATPMRLGVDRVSVARLPTDATILIPLDQEKP